MKQRNVSRNNSPPRGVWPNSTAPPPQASFSSLCWKATALVSHAIRNPAVSSHNHVHVIWMVVSMGCLGLLLWDVHVCRQQAQYWKEQYFELMHPVEERHAMASWDDILRHSLYHSLPQVRSFPLSSSAEFDAVLQQVYHSVFIQNTTGNQHLDNQEEPENDDFISWPFRSAPTTADNYPPAPPPTPRRVFDVVEWQNSGKISRGGLLHQDRILLGEIYQNASSVLEYGLGESTLLADYLGVPRYAGIDSDPTFVANVRSQVSSPHFRFYMADIGATKAWGYPAHPSLAKNVLNYQVMPLLLEPLPFDVYLVDGRWRLACMLLCFLHASARAPAALALTQTTNTTNSSTSATDTNTSTTNAVEQQSPIVLIHDCKRLIQHTEWSRRAYKQADHLLQLVLHSGAKLCVYQRRLETTDRQLFDLWNQFVHVVA